MELRKKDIKYLVYNHLGVDMKERQIDRIDILNYIRYTERQEIEIMKLIQEKKKWKNRYEILRNGIEQSLHDSE